jgi:hypothetical protein
MNNRSTTPSRLKALLWACILGVIVSLGVNFLVYGATRNTAVTVGKDTAPSIVAANHINALLADAHSNAMNAMVTNEKSGGKFWTLYRNDMLSLHSQLIDISKNMTFGDAQRSPILAIMSNVSIYEYTLGGAVSNGAQISVDQFGEANRLMQQKILPASVTLNKVFSSYLDATYNRYIKNIDAAMMLLVAAALIFLIILLGSSYYLFKKTHRLFNIGLVLATILFAVNIVYSISSLNSVKSDLYSAKHDAFDSIQVLWSARATAYNANAIKSLYLLHNGTGIVQTADTINFNLSSSSICSDPAAALNGGKSEGYLSDELNNITFQGEKSAAVTALQEWVKYVDIDKQIRNLEYDSKHNEAIALSVGESAGQSNYEFANFDNALGKAIDINQTYFDSNMSTAFKKLSIFPYVTLSFLLIIILTCVLGLKPRIEEYKA